MKILRQSIVIGQIDHLFALQIHAKGVPQVDANHRNRRTRFVANHNFEFLVITAAAAWLNRCDIQ